MKDHKPKHHVARELIKLKGNEPQTNELLSSIIRGSARSVGILFQEFTKKVEYRIY